MKRPEPLIIKPVQPGPERRAYLATPVGLLTMIERGGAISEVLFSDGPEGRSERSPCLDQCRGQLEEYFAGRRREFDLSLNPAGTPFERKVWHELLKIPFGRTTTYGRIARALGSPAAARAVGAANGKNPISIIIPCHRVVGGDGSLTGYGGGLWRKEWLLGHEQAPGFLRRNSPARPESGGSRQGERP